MISFEISRLGKAFCVKHMNADLGIIIAQEVCYVYDNGTFDPLKKCFEEIGIFVGNEFPPDIPFNVSVSYKG